MSSILQNGTQSCQRCGTCCTKGGPALHRDDRHLVEKGTIALKDLYTIRNGEPVYDNVKAALDRAHGEIIKIKGCQGRWTCCFFEEAANACRIYSRRPLECRLLKCWDSGELESMYHTDRLQRKDLVGDVEGLWDLITDHEDRCSYLKIADWIRRMQEQRASRWAARIVEAINYDTEIRKLLAARKDIDPELFEFFFGRPLADTFAGFGYKIKKKEGKVSFVRGTN